MATAAKRTIATVHEIMEIGSMDPETIVTPGIFVSNIVKIERGHPGRRFQAGLKRRQNMSHYTKRSKQELAQRVAQDIFDGAYVNLGIGQPTLVANYLPRAWKSCCTARTASRHGRRPGRRQRRTTT